MNVRLQLTKFALCMCVGLGLQAATITTFGPASWGVSDATLGFTGSYETEDFEDLELSQRLRISILTDQSTYGPSTTLNQLFDPATGDPNGGNWTGGIWDGNRTLLNRLDPIPPGYFGPPGFFGYGTVTFEFIGGATKVGFSVFNNEVASQLAVNGVPMGSLLTGNIVSGSGRNGYVVIEADANTPVIYSVSVLASVIDMINFDHLLYQLAPMTDPPGGEVPEPSTWALIVLGGVAVLFRRRTSR